jgi:hypothetical protein
MEFATFSKIGVLIIWPFIFLLFLYFKDKEKFKKRLKEVLGRDG